MNQEEIVASLADTLAKTRAELDALRTLFTCVLAEISEPPEKFPTLPYTIQQAIERDTAFVLNSQMPDQMLDLRTIWLHRLMTQRLQQRVWPLMK